MRLLFPVMLGLAAAASAQPATAPGGPVQPLSLLSTKECPEVSSHFTHGGSAWRGDPVGPRKLAELPPADTYAAVYRRDERGCVIPVLYRDVRR